MSVSGASAPAYVPAAFFMHFDPAYHLGQAAIDKHLEYFRYTGMDFVKIQYEQPNPPAPPIRTPQDWARVPHCNEEFFDPVLQVVRGLVAAAKSEALVILTVYSPFMWAKHYVKPADLAAHLQENPEAVKKGLEIMTDNVLTLLRGCKRPASTASTPRRKAAKPSASAAQTSSKSTSSQPTWRCGTRSSRAHSTSCTSATMTAATTT